jgi:hypothetical protein
LRLRAEGFAVQHVPRAIAGELSLIAVMQFHLLSPVWPRRCGVRGGGAGAD